MPEELTSDIWPELYRGHVGEWGRRFAAACAACTVDGVVVFSGAVKQHFRDDMEYPFFAEPYFKAWVPEAYPDSALRIVPGQTPLLIHFQSTDFWHMPAPKPVGYWTDHFEIRVVSTKAALLKELGTVSGMAGIGEEADVAMGFASVNDAALLTHLDFYRACKTSYEVACIEEANRIAARGHAAAQRLLTDQPSEFDLNEIYCRATGQRESRLAYQNIVALNEHAGILHYQHLDIHPPTTFRSFLLDAGADFNGYAADVTRTWSTPGDPFSDLISTMDAMQRRLCAGARDGVSYVSLNEFAHRLLAQVLAEHGITRSTPDECFDRGITRTFLPHGLGHLLGLQVHDAAGHQATPSGARNAPPDEHPFLRLTRTLERGFVVTIEPGLYFIPALLEELRNGRASRLINWDRIESFLPYGGIRVEDNVLVTETESRNLSRSALLQEGLS